MLGGVFLISSFLRALLRARSASIRRGCPKEEEKKEREKAPDETGRDFCCLTMRISKRLSHD